MAAASSAAVRILVDGHGGDSAPNMIIEALSQTVAETGLTLGVVGIPDILGPLLDQAGLRGCIELVESQQIIEMNESPASVLRGKRNSSIHVGAAAVRDKSWDAFVSAGNTGALMAISKLILKTLPGIDRPAIASMIPAKGGGRTLLLDAGANVGSSSEHLLQFAILGSCYMQTAEGIAAPRVGLLNIGSEDIKGTDEIKVAATLLRESKVINFIGNVEGTDIFSDRVDVVVCDGFVGNVALKTMEGVASLIIGQLKQDLQSSLLAKMGTMLAAGGLRNFKRAIEPSEHNGAPLLGLNGLVVKSHGGTDAKGFARAIQVAKREAQADLNKHTLNILNNMAVG